MDSASRKCIDADLADIPVKAAHVNKVRDSKVLAITSQKGARDLAVGIPCHRSRIEFSFPASSNSQEDWQQPHTSNKLWRSLSLLGFPLLRWLMRTMPSANRFATCEPADRARNLEERPL